MAPYLYRYIDLFILSHKTIIFTRLDKLEDPFEGLSTKFLRDNAHIKTLEYELRQQQLFNRKN